MRSGLALAGAGASAAAASNAPTSSGGSSLITALELAGLNLWGTDLLAGQGRASALREAMRSLRGSRPHPHYWAPFIALGRDAPLRALKPTP